MGGDGSQDEYYATDFQTLNQYMFSNKDNINILTSLLIEYGVSDAVVCPGSRNAPIVHNLSQCQSIRCHPITDERSAGFFALGIAQATQRPTVVCVTSGTALLNLAPAVAEAYYQHVPLVVVSADRPSQWINQLDGQTLPQPDALGRFVRKAVSLPEPHIMCKLDDGLNTSDSDKRWEEECWMCRRLANEALHSATCRQSAPVHINVPITEPLFTFDVAVLPVAKRFRLMEKVSFLNQQRQLFERFFGANRPMIVIGQLAYGIISPETIRSLSQHYVVMAEPLSNLYYQTIHFDEAVRVVDGLEQDQSAKYAPDYIIYIGDTLVSKPTRRWLRSTKAASCFITPDALDLHDPIMTLEDIVECPLEDVDLLLSSFCDIYDNPEDFENDEDIMAHEDCRHAFYLLWQQLLDNCAERAEAYEPAFSQMATVKYFEEQLADLDTDICVHYANSSAVRLACIYAQHYVWCNRGVNGIEGSLSTAAGFSLATDAMTVCIIGDLSFFYDQNALWNSCIGGNLRIVLLNNNGGGIFRQLKGLDKSPVANSFVSAHHETTAQGICTQNDIGYISAKDMNEMQIGIVTLLTRETDRPMVLEVFTDAEEDMKAMANFFASLT